MNISKQSTGQNILDYATVANSKSQWLYRGKAFLLLFHRSNSGWCVCVGVVSIYWSYSETQNNWASHSLCFHRVLSFRKGKWQLTYGPLSLIWTKREAFHSHFTGQSKLLGEGGGQWYKLNCFSHVWLFVTLWTVAPRLLLVMGFSRQEYWSGLPFPLPGDLIDLGI